MKQHPIERAAGFAAAPSVASGQRRSESTRKVRPIRVGRRAIEKAERALVASAWHRGWTR
jgi:hypothetical protein